jgi:hypothetical protein
MGRSHIRNAPFSTLANRQSTQSAHGNVPGDRSLDWRSVNVENGACRIWDRPLEYYNMSVGVVPNSFSYQLKSLFRLYVCWLLSIVVENGRLCQSTTEPHPFEPAHLSHAQIWIWLQIKAKYDTKIWLACVWLRCAAHLWWLSCVGLVDIHPNQKCKTQFHWLFECAMIKSAIEKRADIYYSLINGVFE